MIAFAYADTRDELSALYTPLAEGLVENLRSVFPQETIAMVTDDGTPAVKGVHQVLRVERNAPLMVWRLKAHQMAHSMADEIMFVEPDVRFNENVMYAFPKECDVCVTTREQEVMLENERRNTPFTLGMTFSRNAEFWREAKIICQTLDARDQIWFGDMLAIAEVIQGGKFKVEMLDGSVYNHVVNNPAAKTSAKVLHYKGKRKTFLFNSVVEEAA